MLNVKLNVVGGDAKTTQVNLKLPTIIGRSKNATLTLPHPLVSRNHCELFDRAGKLWVKDLESLNGTFIDNVRLEGEQILEPKQLLTIGNVTFRAVYGVEALDEEGNVLDEGRDESSFAKPGDSSKSLDEQVAAAKSDLAAEHQEIEFHEEKPSDALHTKPTEAGRPKKNVLPIDETVFAPEVNAKVKNQIAGNQSKAVQSQSANAESNQLAAGASIISALANIEESRPADNVSLSALQELAANENLIQHADISSVNIHDDDSDETPQIGQSFLNAIDEEAKDESKISADESSLGSFIRKLPR